MGFSGDDDEAATIGTALAAIVEAVCSSVLTNLCTCFKPITSQYSALFAEVNTVQVDGAPHPLLQQLPHPDEISQAAKAIDALLD